MIVFQKKDKKEKKESVTTKIARAFSPTRPRHATTTAAVSTTSQQSLPSPSPPPASSSFSSPSLISDPAHVSPSMPLSVSSPAATRHLKVALAGDAKPKKASVISETPSSIEASAPAKKKGSFLPFSLRGTSSDTAVSKRVDKKGSQISQKSDDKKGSQISADKEKAFVAPPTVQTSVGAKYPPLAYISFATAVSLPSVPPYKSAAVFPPVAKQQVFPAYSTPLPANASVFAKKPISSSSSSTLSPPASSSSLAPPHSPSPALPTANVARPEDLVTILHRQIENCLRGLRSIYDVRACAYTTQTLLMRGVEYGQDGCIAQPHSSITQRPRINDLCTLIHHSNIRNLDFHQEAAYTGIGSRCWAKVLVKFVLGALSCAREC